MLKTVIEEGQDHSAELQHRYKNYVSGIRNGVAYP